MNSVDFVSCYTFTGLIFSHLAASMRIIRNISWVIGFSILNAGLMGKAKSLLKNPGDDH